MMKMRQQFVNTVADIMKSDERVVLLLGDIGVFGFRQVFADYPDRVYNIGILEQSTIGAAAGLAMAGFIPIVHTIAPFLVERSYEQLKDDFGYQGLNGNFVSVGASYDYAALGCTHHCPGDVGILKQVPNMSIIVPGTAKEFDILFKEAYQHKDPTYYRLSEGSNLEDREVAFGRAELIKKGSKATVIAVGPMLQAVLEATQDMDINLLYYTTVQPFDADTLRKVAATTPKIVVCEPYYTGALSREISAAMLPRPVAIEHIGVPHRFLDSYGTMGDHDRVLGLTAPDIRLKILDFIDPK
jgi:transketolase